MKNVSPWRWMAVLSLTCLLLSGNAHGLVNGNAPAEDDKRFDAVAAFSRTSWLTVNEEGKGGHNWFGNGVLIAPDVVLIAKHLLPKPVLQGKTQASNQFIVRFRRHADESLGSKEAGPNSYHQATVHHWILSSKADLALGILSKPVEHIDPVKLLLDSEAALLKRKCVLAAWGSESPWRGHARPRNGLKVGENTLTRNGGFLRVDSYQIEQREDKDGKNKSYIIDENAVPNMHDSGGSMFIFDDDEKPVLAGIISTYSGGTFLAQASTDEFPLDAAMAGGRELLKILKERRIENAE